MNEKVPLSVLPKLHEYDPDSALPNMSWNIDLPASLDTDRIVVNARHLRHIQKIASFDANHVFSFDGKQAEYDHSISGVNLDGTAMIGFSKKLTPAEKDKNSLYDFDRNNSLMRHYFKTTPLHTLNKPALVDSVVGHRNRKDQITSEEAWALELDRHLQTDIRVAAYKHLIDRATQINRILDVVFATQVIDLMTIGVMTNNTADLIGSVGIYCSMNACLLGIDSIHNKQSEDNTWIKYRRWSLFGHMQPDRYIATVALTHVNDLIQYRR